MDPPDWAGEVAEQVDGLVTSTLSALGTEVRRAIKNKSTSEWPPGGRSIPPQSGQSRATGESMRGWKVKRRRSNIEVHNAIDHAIYLHDKPRIRGRVNPHYLSAMRTVERDWPIILERAADRAMAAADRRRLRIAKKSFGGRLRLLREGFSDF